MPAEDVGRGGRDGAMPAGGVAGDGRGVPTQGGPSPAPGGARGFAARGGRRAGAGRRRRGSCAIRQQPLGPRGRDRRGGRLGRRAGVADPARGTPSAAAGRRADGPVRGAAGGPRGGPAAGGGFPEGRRRTASYSNPKLPGGARSARGGGEVEGCVARGGATSAPGRAGRSSRPPVHDACARPGDGAGARVDGAV